MIKAILSLTLIALVGSCVSQKNDSSQKNGTMEVTLNITLTSDYCGGVPPSDEMLAELKKPKTFGNQNFYISTKKGLEDEMKDVKTSATGSANVSLKDGTYYVFLPIKKTANHSPRDRSEEECTKWRNTPNGSFTVKDNESVNFNIHKACDGCGALRM